MASKGWPALSLKDICLPKNGIRRGPFGGSLKKSSFVPSGYKVYEQGNVIYNDFSSGAYYINEAKFKSLKAFEIFPNDLLISCSGTVGKVVIVPNGIQPGVMNQALLRLRLDSTKVLTKYMWIVLNSDDAQQKLTGATHGSAMKNIVAVGQIKKIAFPIPPIAVQKNIVAILSSWMDAITAVERLIDVKMRLKRGLLKKLLTGKVRFKRFKSKWETMEVGELLSYEQPVKYLVKSIKEYDEKLVPVLTANKSFIRGSTDDKENVYSNLPAIIFDDFTMDSKYVDFPFKVKSSAIKILTPSNKDVCLRFVYEAMKLLKLSSKYHKRYFISEYQYETLDVPPIEEQLAIADFSSHLDVEIEQLQKLLKLKTLEKTGLIQKLLTGEIPVKV